MVPVLQGMCNTVKLHVHTPNLPHTSVKNLGLSVVINHDMEDGLYAGGKGGPVVWTGVSVFLSMFSKQGAFC